MTDEIEVNTPGAAAGPEGSAPPAADGPATPKHMDLLIGTSADWAVDAAIALAYEETIARGQNTPVEFQYNDVHVTVEHNSDPALIRRDLERASMGYIDGNEVEAHPPEVLSPEVLSHDAEVEAANDLYWQQQNDEYDRQLAAQAERLHAALEGAPDLDLVDPERWAEIAAAAAGDPLNTGVLDYARRWGRLMQVQMANGEALEEIFSWTSHEADLEGMSGWSMGEALWVLTDTWRHGSELLALEKGPEVAAAHEVSRTLRMIIEAIATQETMDPAAADRIRERIERVGILGVPAGNARALVDVVRNKDIVGNTAWLVAMWNMELDGRLSPGTIRDRTLGLWLDARTLVEPPVQPEVSSFIELLDRAMRGTLVNTTPEPEALTYTESLTRVVGLTQPSSGRAGRGASRGAAGLQ